MRCKGKQISTASLQSSSSVKDVGKTIPTGYLEQVAPFLFTCLCCTTQMTRKNLEHGRGRRAKTTLPVPGSRQYACQPLRMLIASITFCNSQRTSLSHHTLFGKTDTHACLKPYEVHFCTEPWPMNTSATSHSVWCSFSLELFRHIRIIITTEPAKWTSIRVPSAIATIVSKTDF